LPPEEVTKVSNETHIPTEQPQAEEDARLPCADAHDRRTERDQAAASAGPSSPGRLNGRLSGGLSKRRFDEVFQEGRRIQTRYCRIVSLEGPGRVGFATAKTIGSKPKRNRAKRRLREAVRLLAATLPPNADVIFVGKAALHEADWNALLKDLGDGLRALGGQWANESASDL
jgi:ribonuclease P protein component